jgi:hypothetical protein
LLRCLATRGRRRFDRRRVRVLPVEHQDLADVLHRGGLQGLADLREVGFALVALVAGHLHLDQLVAPEVGIDLAQHRVSEALCADHHDRVQAVGAGLERFALDG